LLLLPHRNRVVLEVDGIQHYASGDRPDPHRYSEMVAEDRKLRLAGYEIYRFGGEELTRSGAASTLTDSFEQLLKCHGIAATLSCVH
jgi:very-short-patch-repair endonuclease